MIYNLIKVSNLLRLSRNFHLKKKKNNNYQLQSANILYKNNI